MDYHTGKYNAAMYPMRIESQEFHRLHDISWNIPGASIV
jgi:hypothetical protein